MLVELLPGYSMGFSPSCSWLLSEPRLQGFFPEVHSPILQHDDLRTARLSFSSQRGLFAGNNRDGAIAGLP